MPMADNSLNIKEYNNKQALLFPASVGDYLKEDDLAHVIDEAVDQISLQSYYQKISPVGNPCYHPALMLKIWFYGYATKTFSSRKIEDKLHKDIAFIYLAGMQKPDHKTISEFRKNNCEEMKETFVEILQICHRLGMTKLGEISLDSQVMKANASAERSLTEKNLIKEREKLEKAVQQYLDTVSEVDAKDDSTHGVEKRGDELPTDIAKKQDRIRKMKEEIQKLKIAQQKLKEGELNKINLTDSDARFQKDKTRIVPGYRAEVAVDSQEQVIVAVDATNSQHDSSQLLPMIDTILENVEKLQLREGNDSGGEQGPIKLSADAGYNSGNNLKELETEPYKEKVDAYIPDNRVPDKERGAGHDLSSPFHRSKFHYDEKENCFICPEGNKLYREREKISKGIKYDSYRAKGAACRACSFFGQCTSSKSGRTIWFSKNQHFIDEMRTKLSSKEGREIYRKRKIIVEPVFGNISLNLGIRGLLLRGLRKIRGELSLICIVHNLIKIFIKLRKIGSTLREALINKRTLAPINAA